mgnify:FL=1
MNLFHLSDQIKGLSPDKMISALCEQYPGKVVFTTSFGIEDQVITDIIVKNKLPVRIITLDTGRLFEETYRVFSNTLKKYNKPVETFFPDPADIEKLLTEKGPFSFYKSIENRKECCYLRKVKPLNRSLKGMKIWITGIRKDQSQGRSDGSFTESDDERGIIKVHPLFTWTMEEVEDYVRQHNVPCNSLHDKGFISIGCEPCTRAIKPGEDFRSGRWWWEDTSGKECGLHK